MPIERLTKTIFEYSSYTDHYSPHHLLENKPNNSNSRWRSAYNENSVQYVTFQLEKPAIIHYIYFSKADRAKAQINSLKDFKVYGGLDTSYMKELLNSALANDDEPETFQLHTKVDGLLFPSKFVKIVLCSAYKPSLHFNVWYIELLGETSEDIVGSAVRSSRKHREDQALNLCLKHMRRKNFLEPYSILLSQNPSIELEHPILTQLHSCLVLKGEFEKCETLLDEAHKSNLFNDYLIDNCKYQPIWHNLHSESNTEPRPGMRGGHQMCIDSVDGQIFLFGGWDGNNELGDFWRYDLRESKWHCISQDTQLDNGPCPRSCHKICYDEKTKRIYTLGRFLDVDNPAAPTDSSGAKVNISGDFFYYDLLTSAWVKLTDDTHRDGGPHLIFDHQMCIDVLRGIIYVFGGRVIINQSPPDAIYSGLYAYEISTKKWTQLRGDSSQPKKETDYIHMKPRIGHSMLFYPPKRHLYIFAGQRNRAYLGDYYIYDVENDQVIELSRDLSKQGGPEAGFTQRATLDHNLDEMYVLSGLMIDKQVSRDTIKNSFWVYHVQKEKWTCVYKNKCTDPTYWEKMKSKEPRPRYAHQLVYDSQNRCHYLFGGNPGLNNTSLRLDDFWSLVLTKPKSSDILRKAKLMIRKQQYLEMCRKGKVMEGLAFLQSSLSEMVDHSNPTESLQFRSLANNLFEAPQAPSCSLDESEPHRPPPELYEERMNLFDELAKFFLHSSSSSSKHLLDLV
eukprot:TRINITY_DN1876_c0_g1_i1.p1 TRINITY_DN1876_c0_g1~~TRINITY_DN1876_c0_g1_i1.p1  ORF type:complete len:733 (-),score=108.15 TRINITY_DN1876_c0_g1_i1:57-2255(-)